LLRPEHFDAVFYLALRLVPLFRHHYFKPFIDIAM
jgi:hypothetical protein